MATNGLNKITERIVSAAEASAEKILAEAQEDCNRIAAEYRSRAAEIERANEQNAGQKSADLLARAKSSAAMAGRNLVGEAKSELIESVFENAFRSVCNREKKEYTALVVGLLAAALEELAQTEERNLALYGEADESAAEAYEVVLNGKDREAIGTDVINGVRKKLNGVLSADRLEKLRLSESTANIEGGVILRYGDVESNCSLEMLFSQLRRDLETDVSRALFAADDD